jgi:branched-chain amino acid transport system ATP-binding protein
LARISISRRRVSRGSVISSMPKLDEPSLGLAPIVVDQVMAVLHRLRGSGTILLVEQMVERALEIADQAYVMQNGVMIGSGTPQAIRSGDLICRAYLGAVSDRAS